MSSIIISVEWHAVLILFFYLGLVHTATEFVSVLINSDEVQSNAVKIMIQLHMGLLMFVAVFSTDVSMVTMSCIGLLMHGFVRGAMRH
jgi:hypothetical protein